MPHFSARSLAHLATCHPDLQRLAHAAIEKMDFAVICGHRNKADQENAVAQGRSKCHWPTSKHNSYPSLAMDLAPWPIDWDNTKAFKALASVVKETAKELGISIEWAGDWRHFAEYPHFQLVD